MLINLLSNIWLYPIYTLNNKPVNEQLMDLKKLQESYGFTKIINLDNDFSFWWLKNEDYIPEIQQNIDQNNLSKIEKKFKYYIKLINKTINNPDNIDNNILFISINTIEILYLFHLYIYIKYTDISKTDRNLTLGIINIIKSKYPFEININDENLKSLIF